MDLIGQFTCLAIGKSDGDEVSLGALDLSLHEALGLIWNPTGFLGIVGLGLVNTFLFQGHEEVGGGIGVLLLLYWLRHVGWFSVRLERERHFWNSLEPSWNKRKGIH